VDYRSLIFDSHSGSGNVTVSSNVTTGPFTLTGDSNIQLVTMAGAVWTVVYASPPGPPGPVFDLGLVYNVFWLAIFFLILGIIVMGSYEVRKRLR
jgi:hypothetical protein